MSEDSTPNSVPVSTEQSLNGKERKKIGRPTVRSPELAVIICERLASGETLRAVSRDKEMPDFSTIYRWLEDDELFRKQYLRARERQADYFADEILEIADGAKDGHTAHAAKVRIDARIWHASKTNRTKYGDKPGDIHVTTAVGNFVIPTGRLTQLQERRTKQLSVVRPIEIQDKTAA